MKTIGINTVQNIKKDKSVSRNQYHNILELKID